MLFDVSVSLSVSSINTNFNHTPAQAILSIRPRQRDRLSPDRAMAPHRPLQRLGEHPQPRDGRVSKDV